MSRPPERGSTALASSFLFLSKQRTSWPSSQKCPPITQKDIHPTILATLIGVGQRDTFQELAGAAHFLPRELNAPACPSPFVLCAVQKIFVGIDRRSTYRGLAAGGHFVNGQEVPNLLRDFKPGT